MARVRKLKIDTGMGFIRIFVSVEGTVADVGKALEAIGRGKRRFIRFARKDGKPLASKKAIIEHFRGRKIDTMLADDGCQLPPMEPIAEAIRKGEVLTPLFLVN